MRKAILIVDDDEMNRELLSQMFDGEYDIYTAEDGREAISQIGRHMDELAVILLDLIMPVLDGYQVLQALNSRRIINKIPVVLITAQDDEGTELSCYSLGASAVISKPFVAQTVIQRVNNLIEVYRNADALAEKIEYQNKEIEEQRRRIEFFNDNLIDVVSNVIEFRDMETGTHVKNIKGLTKIMAETYMEMYPDSGLSKQIIEIMVRASALHDIGKIAISDTVLLKPGRLTDDERKIMMGHTTKGCDLLKLLEVVSEDRLLGMAYDICRHHHERYDGRGYPDGLKGEEIPLSAGIVAIVDVYDALVSERVYKKAFSSDKAYEMIINGECGVFSDKLLECFTKAREKIEKFVKTEK